LRFLPGAPLIDQPKHPSTSTNMVEGCLSSVRLCPAKRGQIRVSVPYACPSLGCAVTRSDAPTRLPREPAGQLSRRPDTWRRS
jgi:hypothetical protein